MADVTIALESPRQDDVARLIEALDAYHRALYRPRATTCSTSAASPLPTKPGARGSAACASRPASTRRRRWRCIGPPATSSERRSASTSRTR